MNESSSPTPLGVLTLPLKGVYFDQIASGEKRYEYRLRNAYWEKRLLFKSYSGVVLTKGYPKVGDESRRIRRPWLGWLIEVIKHPHFGPHPVEVFAIRVNP